MLSRRTEPPNQPLSGDALGVPKSVMRELPTLPGTRLVSVQTGNVYYVARPWVPKTFPTVLVFEASRLELEDPCYITLSAPPPTGGAPSNSSEASALFGELVTRANYCKERIELQFENDAGLLMPVLRKGFRAPAAAEFHYANDKLLVFDGRVIAYE